MAEQDQGGASWRDPDEAVVREAIIRLGQPVCCGEPLGQSPVEGFWNLMCTVCSARHCPFCGEAAEDCDHFVWTTGEIDADGKTPEMDIPDLTQDEDGPRPVWSDAQKQEAFGDLAFLLPDFEGYFDGQGWSTWDETALAETVIGTSSPQVVSLSWAGWWMAASSGTDHFSEDANTVMHEWETTRSELEIAIRRLLNTTPIGWAE